MSTNGWWRPSAICTTTQEACVVVWKRTLPTGKYSHLCFVAPCRNNIFGRDAQPKNSTSSIFLDSVLKQNSLSAHLFTLIQSFISMLYVSMFWKDLLVFSELMFCHNIVPLYLLIYNLDLNTFFQGLIPHRSDSATRLLFLQKMLTTKFYHLQRLYWHISNNQHKNKFNSW